MICLGNGACRVYTVHTMASIRRTEIHARRVRRKKLAVLRARLAEAKGATEKEKILSKIARIAPWVKAEEGAKHGKKA